MLGADGVGDVPGVSDQLGDVAHTGATEPVGPEPDHAACRGDCAQLVIGEVARKVLQGPGAGVRGHHGSGRRIGHGQQGGLVGVGDVD